MITGLDRIAFLLRLYAVRTDMYSTSDQCSTIRPFVVRLYFHILKYQASLVCQLDKRTFERGIRSILRQGQWQDLLDSVESANNACLQFQDLIDKAAERARLATQSQQMEKAYEVQKQILDVLSDMQKVKQTEKDTSDCQELLQTLSSDYLGHKNYNEKRVKRTCEWFLQDEKFHRWRESRFGLLWVSAGPGCVKSVLSRCLIDEGLLLGHNDTSTVCHFFFKDDDIERTRPENALSSILHQLYSTNPASDLIQHALPAFKANGKLLFSMFHKLWDLLIETSHDPAAEGIVCLLDALDECEANARKQLLDELVDLYSDARNAGVRLKFIVTSRPYNEIGVELHRLSAHVNFVHFAGDDESETIKNEVNLVIEHRIPLILPGLDDQSQAEIIDHLNGMQHRTYLWLHLVLDVIKQKFMSHATATKIKSLMFELPLSVSQAYEKILGRSTEPNLARIILQMIVVAKRPFTVSELNVAVKLATSRGAKSYEDLDLEPDDLFASNIRKICGLFVNVHDSKVFLIHQTAREFLLGLTDEKRQRHMPQSPPLVWHHSLDAVQAERVVSQVCLSFLQFRLFDGPIPWAEDRIYVSDWWQKFSHQVDKYPFLQYVSVFWHEHYRASEQLNNSAEVSVTTQAETRSPSCDHHEEAALLSHVTCEMLCNLLLRA